MVQAEERRTGGILTLIIPISLSVSRATGTFSCFDHVLTITTALDGSVSAVNPAMTIVSTLVETDFGRDLRPRVKESDGLQDSWLSSKDKRM